MNGKHEKRVLGRVLAVEESRDVQGGQPGDPITEIGETAPISDQTTRRRDSGTVQDSGTSLDSGTIADCVLSGPLKEDCIGTAGGAANEN